MVALIILLLIYQAWVSRIKKLKREMELRTSIASDLHDEIGSNLTRISLSSELMHIKQSTDSEIIQNISNDSKDAIASISDIIWSVDARNDNREDLLSRMKEHVHYMLGDFADISFEVSGLEKTGTLTQLIRQNTYLIFKEAINNIVRHNHNPQVWITINNQQRGITIIIKNTVDPKPCSTHTGQGLKNMQMRAQRIKASLAVTMADGFFTVTLKTRR
jgi:signal transduction histidine kinase